MRKKSILLTISILFILIFTISSFAVQGVDHRRKTVKIGWFGPLSGALQFIGEAMVDGMKAYITRLNRRGGVKGYKIKLVAYDNNNDPITTKAKLKQLVKTDRIFALVGALGSRGINAVFSDIVSYGVPTVYLGGGEYHWAVPPKRNVFPVQPDYITEGRLMVTFAIKKLNARRIMFVYRHTDSTGKTALRGARTAIKKIGRRVGAKLMSMKRLAVNICIAKIKKVNPDAVLIFDFFGGASGLVSQAKRAGINTKWITTYVNSDAILYKMTGKRWLGVYVGAWAKASGTIVTSFIRYFRTTAQYRKAKRKNWDAPSGYHTAGWIAMEVFIGGLKKFARKYRTMRKLTWANFIRSMESLRRFNNTLAKDITYLPISRARRGSRAYYRARRGQLTLYFTQARLTRSRQFYLHPIKVGGRIWLR